LADSDTARQLWAALALARCDEKGPAIKKVLVKSLKAKGDERYLAAIELARQKEINKTVLKTLIGGVKSAASVETRVATARALGGVEPIPKKAVSALTKGCKADAPQVRSACLAALHLAKPAPKGLMKLALKAAGDDEPEVRASAMARMAYGDDRTISKRVKALTKGLDDSEPKVRRNAIQSLSRIGKPAASAAKRLEELAAGDPDLGVQTTAKNALERIQRGGR
jgi:HEAT repeat protein